MERYVRSFADPDEVIEIPTVRSEMITRDGTTVSHDIQQPGWRWSTHIQPIVGGDWCQVHHVAVLLRGRMHWLMADGTEFEREALSLIDVPPGHDAWVVRDEAVETIAWSGARGWLAPLESLAERVLATILSTDIVDSTGTALRLGDRTWADLLATHGSRTRDILSRFRGREVKMTGDGVLATFDGAARAVRCARELRAAAESLGIRLRIAAHTGEIEEAGADIRGIAIHEASRILSLADAREILVSAVTANLVGNDDAFEDRGEHELRGIAGPRRLYALR